jgi:nickel-dependent lactate racemase
MMQEQDVKTKVLNENEIGEIIAEGLNSLPLEDKRVLILIPDDTRTMPLPPFFRAIVSELRNRAKAVDFMIALGTHPPMSEAERLKLVGITSQEKEETYEDVQIFNHAWKESQALKTMGIIPAAEIEKLSARRLSMEVPVRLNRRILDYDELIICGPVFPHEVVGFSGGNKYFFPGIAGQEIIDFTHWLGALLTSCKIIGHKDTPVRRVINRAAQTIPVSRHAFCSVVTHEGVEGVFFGTPEEAFSTAADLSAQVHIRWCQHPYQRVLSVLPQMYDEIWTGAKGMYKTEPVVADGGEVILYAPHINKISQAHGEVIRKIGYHVRDYFTEQWDKFSHYPWAALAHSTHLRGLGTYENGVEKPRIKVTLATGISEELCHQVNLGYADPGSIHPEEWAGREEEGVLLVRRAGENLYRLKE